MDNLRKRQLSCAVKQFHEKWAHGFLEHSFKSMCGKFQSAKTFPSEFGVPKMK